MEESGSINNWGSANNWVHLLHHWLVLDRTTSIYITEYKWKKIKQKIKRIWIPITWCTLGLDWTSHIFFSFTRLLFWWDLNMNYLNKWTLHSCLNKCIPHSCKIIIFKKKRRQNYRRKSGHRQSLTELKILDIVKK